MAILSIVLAFGYSHKLANADEKTCPDGYRLHYQGFCINHKDELSDSLNGVVRGVSPKGGHAGEPRNRFMRDIASEYPNARIGYKFSNMRDGEYCKNSYVRLSRGKIAGPVAMALGKESCGISGKGNVTLAKAKAEALQKCKSATTKCRIIFPVDKE